MKGSFVTLVAGVAALLGSSAVAQEPNDAIPPAPQGKAWKLVWHDEFDGPALDESKWDVPPDAQRRDGWWMRKAIALDGQGRLAMRTLKDGDRFVDGCVRTRGKFEHAFGYYVARIQLQKQPGHWSAFWLYAPSVGKVGDEGRDGTEIDVMEKPWLDDRVQHTLHWDGYGRQRRPAASARSRCSSSSATRWATGAATSARRNCPTNSSSTTFGCTTRSTLTVHGLGSSRHTPCACYFGLARGKSLSQTTGPDVPGAIFNSRSLSAGQVNRSGQ